MEVVLRLLVGLGLSAACGFRDFVPLLVLSLAAYSGHLSLAESFTWLATEAALITLGAATLLEVGSYYIPWLDNLLDTIATPCAVIAGIITTGSMATDMSPYLRWSLAVIAGGGTAGVIQAGTAFTRQMSSFSTGGLGNPVVSSVELVSAVVLSVIAVIFPIVAILLVLALFFFSARAIHRFAARRRKPVAA